MKFKHLTMFLIILGIFTVSSCKKKDLFEQPTIEVTGYTLLELPGEYTNLEIDMIVHNNDDREATIKDIEYQVEIEGIMSELHEADINKKITHDPMELTLPLTLETSDAVKLLIKLDAGEELSYKATGTFHADEPILKLFDLPIDVSGTAFVEAGFDDYYEQPEVTVDEFTGNYADNGDSFTFDFDVTTTVQNMDPRGVTVDEVEYVVFIEGIESETHFYTDAYSSDLIIDGEGTATLNLPLTLNISESEGETLADAISSGAINYSVEGTLHVTQVEGMSLDADGFMLPLYLTGNTSIDLGDMFEQPTIEVTEYELLELPDEYTQLNITMLVTNNDTREAYITDVEYTAVIEGITAETENEIINQTLLPGTPLELTLPITLLTNDAIQLLTILDAGEELEYAVSGTFHVDEPVLNLFDLPIDITGTATVDVGFEDFFEQPETDVINFTGDVTTEGFPLPTAYTFNLDVNCTVQNMDTHDAVIDEVVYIVTIEGNESDSHTYTSTFSIAGGQTINLTLPVTITLGAAEGLELVQALQDGTAEYIVTGTFHTIEIDGTATDVLLPLYDEGSAPANVILP